MQKYHARLSGPLLDRIDIHVEAPAVKYQELTRGAPGESSAVVRERVVRAREVQLARFKDRPGIYCNAQMSGKDLRAFCILREDILSLLERAMSTMGLSARAFDRILRVSRTIADLAGTEEIQSEHVSEAIHYRSLDRQLWRQ